MRQEPRSARAQIGKSPDRGFGEVIEGVRQSTVERARPICGSVLSRRGRQGRRGRGGWL